MRLYGETLSNTGNPSEERVEGVERALMAERIALPAVGYAESFISLGMDPMITLRTEILKKVVGQSTNPEPAPAAKIALAPAALHIRDELIEGAVGVDVDAELQEGLEVLR